MQLTDQQLFELIEEAKLDEVGLWFIVAKVRNELGVNDPTVIRSTVMDAIKRILDNGEVVAGYYNADRCGVSKWNMDIATILTKIETEWNRLDHDPDIGEIVVFVGTRSVE
jgi:hypothetical protein